MIDLNVKREPFWLELAAGIRVRVRPCSSALMLAARSAFSGEGDASEQSARMMRALAHAAIIEWEGITSDGAPAPITPENIDALLEIWPIYRAFEDQYFGAALLIEDEKKG